MRRVLFESNEFRWIDLSCPSPEEVDEIQQEFKLHPEFVQDCLDPVHLPKFERFGTTAFLIVRLYDARSPEMADTLLSLTRKVGIFVGPDFVITIHRIETEQFKSLVTVSFEELQDRAPDTGKLPFVLVHFLNAAFETFYTPLEDAETQMDEIESSLFDEDSDLQMLQDLHTVRRQLSLIKRILIHSQDAVQRLSPSAEGLLPLYQDLRENLATLFFLSDELLEDATNLFNLQISLSSKKTNDVVRVLTIISVFFMPLTFIVGLYGMNFPKMPEFQFEHGYMFAWGLMIATSLVIGWFFHSRGWLKSVYRK